MSPVFRHRSRLGLAGAALMLLSAAPAWPQTKAPPTGADVMIVRYDSRVATRAGAPGHLTWTVELLAPGGEVVGSLTHDIVCSTTGPAPCPVFDSTDTFNFPQGQIVTRGPESVAPSPADPGQVLVGIHPPGKSIVSGTGIFAGRTGRAQMAGLHDTREMPAFATFDDVWLIELDPR